MARTIRENLTTAAARLRDAGHNDSADAVDAVLAPGGWTLLREQDAAFTTNLPLTTRASLRDALKKAAEAENVTLTAVAAEGYRRVLDGSWTPPQRPKAGKYPAGDRRVVLNVTLDDSLRVQLRERIPALEEELGYKVTEGGIAMEYLRERLATQLVKLLPDAAE